MDVSTLTLCHLQLVSIAWCGFFTRAKHFNLQLYLVSVVNANEFFSSLELNICNSSVMVKVDIEISDYHYQQ